LRLGVGIPYYITKPRQVCELIRAIESVHDHVDVIYLIDGRFTEFPKTEFDYSIYGVNKLLLNYYKVRIATISDTQLVKRQTYLDMAGAAGLDYLMVMDSEEFVHPDNQNWDLFYQELEEHYDEEDRLYFMWFWVDKKWECSANPVCMETWQKYIRILKRPGEIKYHMNHYTYRLKDDYSVNLNSLLCKKTLGGVKLTGDSLYRDRDFLDKKKVWEQEDFKKEQARAWIALNKLEQLSNVVFVNSKTPQQ